MNTGLDQPCLAALPLGIAAEIYADAERLVIDKVGALDPPGSHLQ